MTKNPTGCIISRPHDINKGIRNLGRAREAMALGSLWGKDPEAPAREGRSLGAGPIVENSSFSQLDSPPTGQTQSSFKKGAILLEPSPHASRKKARNPQPHRTGPLAPLGPRSSAPIDVVALVGVRGVDATREKHDAVHVVRECLPEKRPESNPRSREPVLAVLAGPAVVLDGELGAAVQAAQAHDAALLHPDGPSIPHLDGPGRGTSLRRAHSLCRCRPA